MKKIIPLNDDDMFTQIFNDKKYLPVIEEFIADYFNYDLKDVRGNITIDSRKLFKGTLKEKGKEVDLLLNYKDQIIDIEMSTGITAAIINRNITFLSNIYSTSTEKGKTYSEIKKAIQINLLTKYEYDELKLSFSYANIEKGIILSKFPRIDMINMEVGKKMCYTDNEETNKLIKWSKVFMSNTKEELESTLKETVSTNSKELLIEAVSRLSGDEEMIKKHEEKSKWQYTQELYWNDKFEELNIKENEIKSKENEIKSKENEIKSKENEIKSKENEIKSKENEIKSKENEIKSKEIQLNNALKNKEYDKIIEIAKNALNNNLDIDTISNITGLSKKEIIKLQ